MKREEFITFEQSIKLEKFGFSKDVEWLLYYTDDGNIKYCNGDFKKPDDFCCCCVTQSLVQKWFRDRNIIIESQLYNPCQPLEYECVMYKDCDYPYFSKSIVGGVFDRPEDALSKGINKGIEYIEF